VSAPTLPEALEAEHRQIDGGIEEYLASLDADPLIAAMAGLRRHIYLEEAFLFPPLKDAGLTMPIFVMLREHGELWDAMDAIDRLVTDRSDEDATRQAATDLLALLDKHNSKEEPIIYPRADAVLGAEASDDLLAFLADGRTPDGWVCARAGE